MSSVGVQVNFLRFTLSLNVLIAAQNGGVLLIFRDMFSIQLVPWQWKPLRCVHSLVPVFSTVLVPLAVWCEHLQCRYFHFGSDVFIVSFSALLPLVLVTLPSSDR